MEKVSDTEVLASDGSRIKLEQHVLSVIQGNRYLSIPVEDRGPLGVRVKLSLASSWMEDGKPLQSEATLNINWLRSRISAALKVLGRPFTFDR